MASTATMTAPQNVLKSNERLITEDIVFDLKKLDLSNPVCPVLREAKIIGTLSQNKRRYTKEAKAEAMPLYEGASINVNHPQVPNTNRSVYDRFGWLENVHMVGDDLYGDIHFNPKHALAESFMWWAENNPRQIGLSHNAVGQGKDEDGVFVVEKIVAVRSVDLVADPATTKGLHENVETQMPETPPPATSSPLDSAPEGYVSKEDRNYKVGCLMHEIAQEKGVSKEEKRRKIMAAAGLLDDGEGGEMHEAVQIWLGIKAKPVASATPPAPDATPAPASPPKGRAIAESLLAAKKKELAEKQAQLKKIEAEESAGAKKSLAVKLCNEAKLPEEFRSEYFMSQLAACKDEKRMKGLIEERKIDIGLKQKARNGKLPVTMDTKSFMEQLRA